jgi:hypothetical protein
MNAPRHIQIQSFVASLAAGVAIVAVSQAPASASDEFGQHVVTCTQTMGFDSQHNPGMHQGYAGWDPSHVC